MEPGRDGTTSFSRDFDIDVVDVGGSLPPAVVVVMLLVTVVMALVGVVTLPVDET